MNPARIQANLDNLKANMAAMDAALARFIAVLEYAVRQNKADGGGQSDEIEAMLEIANVAQDAREAMGGVMAGKIAPEVGFATIGKALRCLGVPDEQINEAIRPIWADN